MFAGLLVQEDAMLVEEAREPRLWFQAAWAATGSRRGEATVGVDVDVEGFPGEVEESFPEGWEKGTGEVSPRSRSQRLPLPWLLKQSQIIQPRGA